jgi:hypothetical protein
VSPDDSYPLASVPAHHRIKADGLCWICHSSNADSREHRFKSADIRRAYGVGPYSGANGPLRVIDESEFEVQGPKSRQLTFPKSMCKACNNDRTSAADAAYDAFVSFFETHQNTILTTGEVDLGAIYGLDWRQGSISLTRYFAKHIGCRLVEAEIAVRVSVQRFVNQETDHLAGVQIELGIRLDIVAFEAHMRVHGDDTATFWAGDLVCMYSPSSGQITEITGHLGYRWLRATYYVDSSAAPPATLGVKVIALGADANVDPSEVSAGCAECGQSVGEG